MAKQIEITTSGNTFSFPTPQIRVVELGSGSFIDFEGRNFNTASTVAEIVALANTGDTEQVQATIVRVGGGIQTTPLQMSFPASNITIDDSNVSGSNSVIVYRGTNYYASETKDALVDAANAGGGGGTATLQEVLDEGSSLTKSNSISTIGNFNLEFDVSENAEYSASYATINVGKSSITLNVSPDGGATSKQLSLDTIYGLLYNDGGVNSKKIATVEYLVYTALLSQSGTDAPVATILGTNTIGEITFGYVQAGAFSILSDALFTDNKTWYSYVAGSKDGLQNPLMDMAKSSSSQFDISVVDSSGSGVNDGLFNRPIEIRVYP